jgi:hypothetical protein
MRVVTCPGCGRSGKIPDSYTGAGARCPKCSTAMDVPDLPGVEPETIDLGIEVGEPAAPNAAWVGPAAAAASGRLARLTQPQPAPGRLPWYFEFLHLLAMLGVTCGVLISGVGFAVGLFAVVQSYPRVSDAGLALVMYSVGAGIALLVVPALILLALDAARTLRAIRDRLPA